MKDSLLNLQRGIGLRDYSSEAEEKRSRYHWHTTTRPWGHAVQYRTCFVYEPVCGQQHDRGTETEGEEGPTVSWSSRNKERNNCLQCTDVKNPREEVPLCTDRNLGVPNITEALWEGARPVLSLHFWDNCFLHLCFDLLSASYCKPCQPGEWQRGRRKTTACI